MKKLLIWIIAISFSCSNKLADEKKNKDLNYTEIEILKEIDLAFNGIPSSKFPNGKEGDIKYNFFIDLEHGYCETANSKIHLYANNENWAIVLEKNGYQNRGKSIEIELNYIGNCIDYPIDKYPERNYITNAKNVYLVSPKELERIENKSGSDMEQFELIDPIIKKVQIRNEMVEVNLESEKYEALGIELRKHDNPQKLIGFGELIRFLSETNPKLVSATEEEIKTQIPNDLPKLMTIDKFYHLSAYDETKEASQIETYQLIANILVKQDSSIWKPKLESNNHWSNWESGNL